MGYHMVVVKDPSCKSADVTSIVTSIVRGSKNITDVGTELSYVLPSNSTHSFPQLFETLEGIYTGVFAGGSNCFYMQATWSTCGARDSAEKRV